MAAPVATVPEAAAPSGWMPLAEPPVAKAQPPAPVEPPARRSYGVADMGLLRAADAMVAPPVSRLGMSTLSQLSAAPPAGGAGQPHAAPRALFPLIEALDLPGGLGARRGTVVEEPAPQAEPEPLPAPEPAPLPAILMAAEIDLPLPELLRLLAADPAESADAFLALRHPQQAESPQS